MTTHFTLDSRDDDGDFHVNLEIAGGGDLEHYLDAFKAFLIAVGYDLETVNEEIDEINREIDADSHPFSDFEERDQRNELDVLRGKW